MRGTRRFAPPGPTGHPYGPFAEVYDLGRYGEFSLGMVPFTETVLARHGEAAPRRVLDLACGAGHFAVAWALRGDAEVSGLDVSTEMLDAARRRADEAGARVTWVASPLPQIPVVGPLDLITCWFDSLNYLTDEADLRSTFRHVGALLRPGGLFLFDVVTLYGLAEVWGTGVHVQTDTPELVEIHRSSFDHETATCERAITAFVRRRSRYDRIEEVHHQRGYPLALIEEALASAGLGLLDRFGDDVTLEPVEPDTPRAWFAARRPAG